MTILPSPIPHPLDFCPWSLPDWCYEALEWVVGFDWPEGNEKETWDVADAWYAAAHSLAGPRDDAFNAAAEVSAAYGSSGLTAEAFRDAWSEVAEGDDAPLIVLLAMANELGQICEETGCDIEAAKIEAWIELTIFVAELLALAVTVALTVGAATPAAAGIIAATRIAIQQIFKRLVAQLGKKAIKATLKQAAELAGRRLLSKAGLRRLGRELVEEGIEEALEESAINLGIQAYQNTTGRRDGLDMRELGMSALGGLAGGAAAGVFGSGHGGGLLGTMGRGMRGEVAAEIAASLATGGGLPGLDDLGRAATSGAAGAAIGAGRHAASSAFSDLSALSSFDPGALAGLSGPTTVSTSGSSSTGSVSSGWSSGGVSGGATYSGAESTGASSSGGVSSSGGSSSWGGSSSSGSTAGSASSSSSSSSSSAVAASSSGSTVSTSYTPSRGGTSASLAGMVTADAIDAPTAAGPVGSSSGATSYSGGSTTGFAGSSTGGTTVGGAPAPAVVPPTGAVGISGGVAPASAAPATGFTGVSSAGVPASGVPSGISASSAPTSVASATAGTATTSAVSTSGAPTTGAGTVTGGATTTGSATTGGATTSNTASTASSSASGAAASRTTGPVGVSGGATTSGSSAGGFTTTSATTTSTTTTSTTTTSATTTPSGATASATSTASSATGTSASRTTGPAPTSGVPSTNGAVSVSPSPTTSGGVHTAGGTTNLSPTNGVTNGVTTGTTTGGMTSHAGPSGVTTGPTTTSPLTNSPTPSPHTNGATTVSEGARPTTSPQPHTPTNSTVNPSPSSQPGGVHRDGARTNVAQTVSPSPTVEAGRTPPTTSATGTIGINATTSPVTTSPITASATTTTPAPSPSVDSETTPQMPVSQDSVPPRAEPLATQQSPTPTAPTPPPAPGHPWRRDSGSSESKQRAAYFKHMHAQRAAFENRRRRQELKALTEYRRWQTSHYRSMVRHYQRLARSARRQGLDLHADHYQRSADAYKAEIARLKDEVRRLREQVKTPARVDIADHADWQRLNTDRGQLAYGGVETSEISALTGTDHPPSAASLRPYNRRGGLRPPLALHQRDLERAVPRDMYGNIVRTPDPRQGNWFRLVNDGGPQADATRGINCLDCTLSFFETWMHGRPRVAAPRTLDAYAGGDPNSPIGGEEIGAWRAEYATGGRYQNLLPDLTKHDLNKNSPDVARALVEDAFARLHNHLLNAGHGSIALIANMWEGGAAHAWAAINQNGTILYLDPQTGALSENIPIYGHFGVPRPNNIVAMDALVIGSDGKPFPLPNHGPGIWNVLPFSATGDVADHSGHSAAHRAPTGRPDPTAQSDSAVDFDPAAEPAAKRDLPTPAANRFPEFTSPPADAGPPSTHGQDDPTGQEAHPTDAERTASQSPPQPPADEASEPASDHAEPAGAGDLAEQAREVLDTLRRPELLEYEPLPVLGGDDFPVRRGEDGLITEVQVDGDWVPLRDFLADLTLKRAELWRQYAADPDFPGIKRRTAQPCISLAVDRLTGNITEGHNNLDISPMQLHPLLRERLERYLAECEARPEPFQWGTRWNHFSDPGTHAEVYAVSELLWEREAAGLPVDDSVMSQLRIDNNFPWFNKGRGKPAPCCGNCTALLYDVPCNAGKRPYADSPEEDTWPE